MLLTDMLKRVRRPGNTRVTAGERKRNFKKKTRIAPTKVKDISKDGVFSLKF